MNAAMFRDWVFGSKLSASGRVQLRWNAVGMCRETAASKVYREVKACVRLRMEQRTMLDLLAIFPISDLFLLGAFSLSLVLVCKCALQLLLGNQHTPRWVEAVFATAALVTVGVLVVDAIHWFDGQTASDLRPLVGVATIV
ncbi:MAG TPA: hypothetical protein VFB96_22015, partial [Pirellulaceae bacterium]|nr:hypothetical protein [Pirellulaceae bacterium]